MYIRFNTIIRFLLTISNNISNFKFKKEQLKMEQEEIKRFNNSII